MSWFDDEGRWHDRQPELPPLPLWIAVVALAPIVPSVAAMLVLAGVCHHILAGWLVGSVLLSPVMVARVAAARLGYLDGRVWRRPSFASERHYGRTCRRTIVDAMRRRR